MSIVNILIGIGITFGLSFVLIPLAIKIGHKYKVLDWPGEHKRHKKPTPPLGGAVLFIALWLTIISYIIIFPKFFEIIFDSVGYVFAGSLIIFLVGLSDDLSPLSAWVKLLAQISAGLVLYLGGISVELLTTPFGSVDIGSFSVLLSVAWVVMLTNAVNLIDGLDGLASGVSLIGAVTILFIGQFYFVGGELIYILSLIGFLLIFWFFNRYPAKIFLGDSGSMLIGYFFAAFSLMINVKSYTTAALFVPLLAMGVPMTEMISSFVRRLASGKNVMKADRRHLFHYLALSGLSRQKVIGIFYLLAMIYGLFALAMFLWDRALVLGILVVFMVVIFVGFFIFITKLRPLKKINGRN